MYEMDEECGQIISMKVNYGANPSFTLSNLKNNRAISGIRLFASELQKVMTFYNETMNLYPESVLSRFGAPSRVPYDNNSWFH